MNEKSKRICQEGKQTNSTINSTAIYNLLVTHIFQYLLLHLHILKDGVHPPGLGKHGTESCCVSNDEDPCPNLSKQQAHT